MCETIRADETHPLGFHDYSTAVKLTWAALTISNLVFVLYFVAIQYLLRKTQESKSRIKPTTVEIQVAIAALWIVHRILDFILSTSFDATARIVCSRAVAIERSNSRHAENWVPRIVPAISTWWHSCTFLFWEVMLAWITFLILSLSSSLAPRIQDGRQNYNKAFARFKRRSFELANFTGSLFSGNEDVATRNESANSNKRNKVGVCIDENKYGQSIAFRRYKDDNAKDGQRTLNWDLKVDHEAMREMMETLGPPGGFGELGFNISKDQVCFGAMGVGTRFNLTFILESETRPEKSETTPDRKGGLKKKKNKN